MAEPYAGADNPAGHALRMLRLIWGALLMTQLAVAGIVFVFMQTNPPEAGASMRRALFLGAVGMLCVLTPLGLFVRNQTYKAHWRGPAVSPAGYLKGNLIFLSMLESVALAAVVFAAIAGLHAGLLAVAGAAVLLQLANYPTGRPMRPRGPSLPELDKP